MNCMVSSLYVCCFNHLQLYNFSQDIPNIHFYQWNKNLKNPATLSHTLKEQAEPL